ncbi:flagellar biosynthetic protein FliR [Mobiluncus massiliensis]|uniref:flagellar biosynthetic protein FliR n=1 Tax=uncultured Mobiluncus sp. TaxID=293425 RepID=UPI0024AC8DD0|nr:flagellar biosynthetic protein FliR [Mobiluncus sp. Marseille-Q7826]
MTINLALFTAFALATVRATVFLALCPPFNSRAISGRVKALLGAALGFACMSRVGPIEQSDVFLFELLIQALIGFSMAVMVRIIIAALQMAGSLIDFEGGFAMAQAFDPLTMTNQATFGRVYELTAMAMLFATNGYQLLIMGLARSFNAMPVGAVFDMANYADRLVFRFGELMIASIEIAGPLLLVLFLTDMGLGLLTKVAPAMNAFTLGFPLKIMMTAFTAPLIMVVIPQVVEKLMDKVMVSFQGVFM